VKEAVFNILGDAVCGALVLDLCCGSGGLGVEALSRGAREVVFVDSSRRALAAARRNLEACGAEPSTWRLVESDASGWLSRHLAAGSTEPWLLLADPPYGRGLASGLAALLGEDMVNPGLLAAVLEHGAEERPEAAGLDTDCRSYGTSRVTVLRPRQEEQP